MQAETGKPTGRPYPRFTISGLPANRHRLDITREDECRFVDVHRVLETLNVQPSESIELRTAPSGHYNVCEHQTTSKHKLSRTGQGADMDLERLREFVALTRRAGSS